MQQVHVWFTPADDEQEELISDGAVDEPKATPGTSKANVPALWLWVCILGLAATGAVVYWAGPWGQSPWQAVVFQGYKTGQAGSEGHTNGVVVSSSKATTLDPMLQHFPQSHLCSNQRWMAGYSHLHHDIVTAQLQPRYLISRAVKAGLADRLTGVITQLYLALLSDRALTMVTIDQAPDLAAVCDMPNINWTHPNPIPEDVMRVTKMEYRQGKVPGTVDTSLYYPMHTVNDYVLDRMIQKENLTAFPSDNPNVQNVLWASNRGASYLLMSNSHHRTQLWHYGLTAENAFMCGFFYLCKPNSAVTTLYERYWEGMSDPDVLKIGIQVRLGDWVFSSDQAPDVSKLLASAANHLDCAQKIEKVYALPGQRVIWYFMSDSLDLSKAVQQKYGSKVLTETKFRPGHVDCRLSKNNPHACDTSEVNLALQHALGQIMTFSKADYHVYSRHSGFGRVGAWLSGKHDNLFEIGESTQCDPMKPAMPSKSAHQWSRI